MRKGTSIPYITHLLAVAAIVGENGGTEDEVVAALLHDAPEDQGGRHGSGHPRAVRRRGGRDSGRQHRHIREPETALARAQGGSTWPASPRPPSPRGSSPRRTSCTTPDPSSPTLRTSATNSGSGSTAGRRVRSGTTGSWWRLPGPGAAHRRGLGRVVTEMERLADVSQGGEKLA